MFVLAPPVTQAAELAAGATLEPFPIWGDEESIAITEASRTDLGERRASSETIATTPHASAEDLLRLVPGLLVSRHGAEGKGRQFFLRGFDAVHGADVELTVDGIPWNEPSNIHGQGYLDLGTVIPEVVTGLVAERGSFRLDQGPFATAGSIRFELGIAPERRGTRLDYEIGSTNRHRVLLSAATRQGSSFFVAEGLRDDGFGTNRATRRVATIGRAALIDVSGHRLVLTGGGHVARFGEPGTLPLAHFENRGAGFYDSLSPDTDGLSARGFLGLRWTRTPASARDAATSALVYLQARRLRLEENFTGFLLDAERGDRVAQAHDFVATGLRLADERPLIKDGVARLITGLDLGLDSIEQHEDRIDASHTAFARNRALDARLFTAGAHAGLSWQAAGVLGIDAGLRLAAFGFQSLGPDGAARSDFVPLVVSPRTTVTFFALPELSLIAAYGNGVRPPEARAAVGAATPGATPAEAVGEARASVSTDLEAGLRWRPDSTWELGVGGFAIYLSREQIFDHLSATTLERGATRRAGLELDVGFRPTRWLELRLDATAVDARFSASGEPVPGAPPIFASFEAHVNDLHGISGGLRAFALGPRPLAHGARAAALVSIDAMARYRRSFWEVSLAIDNVLGSQLREGEFNYASHFDRGVPRSALPRLHFAAGPPRIFRIGIGITH